MKNVQPWVRIPRIIRDIPNTYISHGNKDGHLRQVIDKENPDSQEIRLREIKRGKLTELPVLIVDRFESSKAKEYFIRYETHDRKKILGFCRLRIGDPDNPFLPELYNSAIIRELHVYGKVTIVDKKSKGVQHLGLGQKMVKTAEWIALMHGYGEMCITSGVGVRQYYKNKLGYHLEGMYMKKNIVVPVLFKVLFSIIVIWIVYGYL
jgi:elongator complex protein 3